jgi:hypothetical protein
MNKYGVEGAQVHVSIIYQRNIPLLNQHFFLRLMYGNVRRVLSLETCSVLNTNFISYRENTKQNNAGQFIKEGHHEKA